MKNKEFKDLITQHIWYVYTDGKIGKEWKLPKNYPVQQIEGFTGRQAWILGVIVGQLWARKEKDDFTSICEVDDLNIKISKLIIAAIAEIPLDSAEWEPNEEAKKVIRDAKATKGLKELATIIEELFEDLHIDE